MQLLPNIGIGLLSRLLRDLLIGRKGGDSKGHSANESDEYLVHIRVFIGSPSDLPEERKKFPEIIEFVNKIHAKRMGAIFEAVGWENTLPGMGRPQDRINEDLLTCRIMVMLLGERWGKNRKRSNYSSGFEEEYEIGKENKKHILLYFRRISDAKLKAPDSQLEKVLAFRDKVEQEDDCLFRHYEGVPDWEKKIIADLCKWLDKNPPIRIDAKILNDLARRSMRV